jgi:hypothetical protein
VWVHSGNVAVLHGVGKLTLNLLTTTIVAPPSNASKGQMGFNSAFKGLTQQRKQYFGKSNDTFTHPILNTT